MASLTVNVNNGDCNVASTFSPAQVPTSADDVTLGSNNLNIPTGVTMECLWVDASGTGKLTGPGSLKMYGADGSGRCGRTGNYVHTWTPANVLYAGSSDALFMLGTGSTQYRSAKLVWGDASNPLTVDGHMGAGYMRFGSTFNGTGSYEFTRAKLLGLGASATTTAPVSSGNSATGNNIMKFTDCIFDACGRQSTATSVWTGSDGTIWAFVRTTFRNSRHSTDSVQLGNASALHQADRRSAAGAKIQDVVCDKNCVWPSSPKGWDGLGQNVALGASGFTYSVTGALWSWDGHWWITRYTGIGGQRPIYVLNDNAGNPTVYPDVIAGSRSVKMIHLHDNPGGINLHLVLEPLPGSDGAATDAALGGVEFGHCDLILDSNVETNNGDLVIPAQFHASGFAHYAKQRRLIFLPNGALKGHGSLINFLDNVDSDVNCDTEHCSGYATTEAEGGILNIGEAAYITGQVTSYKNNLAIDPFCDPSTGVGRRACRHINRASSRTTPQDPADAIGDVQKNAGWGLDAGSSDAPGYSKSNVGGSSLFSFSVVSAQTNDLQNVNPLLGGAAGDGWKRRCSKYDLERRVARGVTALNWAVTVAHVQTLTYTRYNHQTSTNETLNWARRFRVTLSSGTHALVSGDYVRLSGATGGDAAYWNTDLQVTADGANPTTAFFVTLPLEATATPPGGSVVVVQQGTITGFVQSQLTRHDSTGTGYDSEMTPDKAADYIRGGWKPTAQAYWDSPGTDGNTRGAVQMDAPAGAPAIGLTPASDSVTVVAGSTSFPTAKTFAISNTGAGALDNLTAVPQGAQASAVSATLDRTFAPAVCTVDGVSGLASLAVGTYQIPIRIDDDGDASNNPQDYTLTLTVVPKPFVLRLRAQDLVPGSSILID